MITKITDDKQLGVAIWLAKNTEVSIKRICELCPNIDELKIILLRNSEVNLDQIEIDPIKSNLCTTEDLKEGERDLESQKIYQKILGSNRPYIPLHARQYIPGAIVWIAAMHPDLKTKNIANMFGKTPQFVSKTLAAKDQIQPIDPFNHDLLTKEIFDQFK